MFPKVTALDVEINPIKDVYVAYENDKWLSSIPLFT